MYEQRGEKGDQGGVGIAGMPGLPGTPVSISLNAFGSSCFLYYLNAGFYESWGMLPRVQTNETPQAGRCRN